ncbi:MAG: glycosyltransferase [Lachnospiraceae bacterium]|nr:glycosyltransferase [Lachnospiraceae bacterium]
MSRVAVLLSAYNGNDYMEQQIASIYQQTFRDFQLYIRDDGSSEEFVEKLRELKQQYPFELIEGENRGFAESFMLLLDRVEDAEFYAFADQDDIWLADKLQTALTWFDEADRKGTLGGQLPALFHSAYDIMDPKGTTVGHFYFDNEGYDFRRSITENHYSGFAMVINRALRERMLKGDPEQIGYHDWWAAMIVQAFGVGYSDHRVMAVHRAHGDNVTTFNMRTRWSWLWNNMTAETDLRRRNREFKRCFYDELSIENRKILDLFTPERYNLLGAVKKCFSTQRWRPLWTSELVVRLLMLIGRI